MIDPAKVTNYNQTTRELEEFILFWVCAAGKNGRTAARCLDGFLERVLGKLYGPFAAIDLMITSGYTRHDVASVMKDCGIGCYSSKARTFVELARSGIDLQKCTVSDLEAIHGIGPKTARCFLLHSRKGAQVAGLDTHILKHLRKLGHDVPKSTPTGKKYLTLEKIVLSLAEEAGMTPAQYDLHIWNSYSIKSTPNGTRS